jgi:SAM-dependent methyltransferase
MSAAAHFRSYMLMALCLGCVIAAAITGPAAAQKIKIEAYPDLDVPYVKTPQKVVEAMLRLADTKPGDIHYDLGSGDGRIVITAVRDFGVRKGVGVDLNPERVTEARDKARMAGVAERTRFIHGDVFKFDFSEATVLTMYLLTHVNLRLRPRVLALKPGTRVVSHKFKMGRWAPDKEARIGTDRIYLWIVPAKVAGRWAFGNYSLELQQTFQQVSGVLRSAMAETPIREAKLDGPRLRFTARIHGKRLSFEGETGADVIEGSLNGQPVRFKRVE